MKWNMKKSVSNCFNCCLAGFHFDYERELSWKDVKSWVKFLLRFSLSKALQYKHTFVTSFTMDQQNHAQLLLFKGFFATRDILILKRSYNFSHIKGTLKIKSKLSITIYLHLNFIAIVSTNSPETRWKFNIRKL